jgi:uncharacterized protein DUF3142
MPTLSFPALLLGAVALSCGACNRVPRSSGPLPHEAYIWQRAWSAPVADAIDRARNDLIAFVPLGAEIGWRGGQPVATKIAIDYDALRRSGRPIAIALRVGSFNGPFRPDDPAALKIRALAKSLIDDARSHGVEPRELQIDFDCAASKLGGYRAWLRAIREEIAPVPVCITALPSWLERREFAALAREAGAFILQVHSVEPPRGPDAPMKLCDPVLAQKWVETAAKIGVPFRVALPTYTYLVAFDSAGKLAGISAEGPLAAWPRDARMRVLRADAIGLFALVQRWTRDRPANMTGVIWYRLPVATDAMNWRWPTLAAIVAGREPRRALRVEAGNAQPCDIALVNEGEIDEPLPARINATWRDARPVSADALGGFIFEKENERAASFRASPGLAQTRLPPGERRAVGWLRLDRPGKIDAVILENN